MQPAATLVTRSTNTLARAVGVFVTLTTSRANQNSTQHKARPVPAGRRIFGNVHYTILYPNYIYQTNTQYSVMD